MQVWYRGLSFNVRGIFSIFNSDDYLVEHSRSFRKLKFKECSERGGGLLTADGLVLFLSVNF